MTKIINNLNIDTNKLVDQFGFKISGLAHRMLKNNDLAKDATQEVWIEILKSIDSFKGNSSISTWVYTIAKRTILRYARSERIYSEHEINWYCDFSTIEYNGYDDDKRQWVKERCDESLTAFCHCLNNDSRLIFLFHDISELSYSQISIIMEIEEDNVRKILSRSRAKIKNFVSRNCIIFGENSNCKCRIKNQLITIDLKQELKIILNITSMIEILKNFDVDFPKKKYWKQFV